MYKVSARNEINLLCTYVSVAEQRATSTVIRSHDRAFIILEIFVARLPRFKSVTAQSRREHLSRGQERGVGHGLLRDEISKDSCRGSACRGAAPPKREK